LPLQESLDPSISGSARKQNNFLFFQTSTME
jgi:hypothetical protein